MARNITVTFSALSFAGKVMKATDEPIQPSNFCVGQEGKTHEPSPVKAPRTCEHCGNLPAYGEAGLVKGIKEGAHTFRILDTEELAAIDERYKGEHKGVIELVPHPAEDVLSVTVPGESVNYLTPSPHGTTHYKSLVALIVAHPELAFVGLHTPQSRTHMYVVRVRKGVLVMEERIRQDNVRQVPDVTGEVDEKMLGLLDAFMPTLITSYDAKDYEDAYSKAMESARAVAIVITETGKSEQAVSTPSSNQVIDILEKQMAKLKAEGKTAKKKAVAARKAPARKTTRKKVTA